MLNHFLLVIAVALMAGTQLIIKHQLNVLHGNLPSMPGEVLQFVVGLTKDGMMWLAGTCLAAAAFLWYYSISRLPLGIAFSYAALSYPFVMTGSQLFLGENYQFTQYVGVSLIVIGILMIAAYS